MDKSSPANIEPYRLVDKPFHFSKTHCLVLFKYQAEKNLLDSEILKVSSAFFKGYPIPTGFIFATAK